MYLTGRKRRRRKGWESKRVSLLVGKLENGSAPPCALRQHQSSSVSWRRNQSRLFFSNTTDAGRCHPWFGTVSTISSSGFGRFGLAPCANASQLGISKPVQPLLGIPAVIDGELWRGHDDLCRNPGMTFANHLQSICPTNPLCSRERPLGILDS